MGSTRQLWLRDEGLKSSKMGVKSAILFLFAVHVLADAFCYAEEERSISYLDIAIDLISKAKRSYLECYENKECSDCVHDIEMQATDCADWYGRGHNKSGLYKIRPNNRLTFKRSFWVFCDMDTDGGGWTVIQRRGDFGRPDDYFYKNWDSYKDGFGDVDKDFWLGNDYIFALTNQKPYSIRFDLQDINLKKFYAIYSDFWIDDESNKYMMHIAGYRGDAGDSMDYHDGEKFSTKDQKNHDARTNCAISYKSAWWYNTCSRADLNKVYNSTENNIYWFDLQNSTKPALIWTEMKIRPKSFTPLFFHLEKKEENNSSG